MTELAGPSAALVRLVVATARDVAERAASWDSLGGRTGDGEVGVTATRAADALATVATDAASMAPGAALRRLARALVSGAPSAVTGLIASGLMAAGRADLPDADAGARVIAGLDAARDAIALGADAAGVHATMLDALSPAADAFHIALSEGASIAEGAVQAAAAAEAGVRATTGVEPGIGGAGEHEGRVPGEEDPGAWLVAVAFAAAAARVG